MESRMAPNLLRLVTDEFRGDTLNRVASAIGETPAKTQAALGGAIPALLAGIGNKVSTTSGAGEVFDALRSNNLDTNQFATAASALTAPNGISGLTAMGPSLLKTVLGDRVGGLTDGLASFAGINRASSGSLLSLALPIILSLIGRRAGSLGGGVAGLMSLFKGQNFLQDIPAGLGSALGLGGAAASVRQGYADVERHAAAYAPEAPRKSSWWKWVVPLALLAGLIWLLTSLFSRPEAPRVAVNPPAAPTVTPPAVTPPAVTPPRVDLGAFIDKVLPNGLSLRIPTNGVENRLIGFIEDKSRAVDKDTWFSFDRLEFETASDKLKPSSQEQLRNVAEILKAYPNVNVKLGGYTDNVGDPAANQRLSQNRAVNTMNELATLGIDRSRLAAEGYGEQFPVADNSTEDGRQRNRRIDIRVTKK
jgi:outer membrane protein OmpA-like peptidoglycan-associated protein